MLTLVDEELHRPGSDRNWQESFYFNWTSATTREFGLTRIGLNRAAATADALVIILRDGRLDFAYAAIGVPISDELWSQPMADGLTIGRLTYTMLEPGTAWRLHLTGADELDLTWTAFTPLVDFAGCFPGDEHAGQEHFEQAGRVRGTIIRKGTQRTIDGTGERDKSWGVRDWAGINGWEWIAAQFGDDLAFNATSTDVTGTRQPAGFVYDAGRVRHVTEVRVDYTWHAEHQPSGARIEVGTADGGHYVFTARAEARVPLVKKGLLIEETPAVFETTIDGVCRTGRGVLEHAYHVTTLETLLRLPRLLPLARHALERGR